MPVIKIYSEGPVDAKLALSCRHRFARKIFAVFCISSRVAERIVLFLVLGSRESVNVVVDGSEIPRAVSAGWRP